MNDITRVQEIVQQLNIIDETLFQKMAEDIGFCEEMLSTILGEKVTVKEVTPQNSVKNLQGRSVVLDALCVLENDKQYNIEVQKADDGTVVAELMHIFTVKDAYDFDKFPKVSARKKQFKESEGGTREVCDLVEQYGKECAEKAAKQTAKRFFQNGASYEMVKDSIPSLSDEELQEIYAESQGSCEK